MYAFIMRGWKEILTTEAFRVRDERVFGSLDIFLESRISERESTELGKPGSAADVLGHHYLSWGGKRCSERLITMTKKQSVR
jgi:hypothetical protein